MQGVYLAPFCMKEYLGFPGGVFQRASRSSAAVLKNIITPHLLMSTMCCFLLALDVTVDPHLPEADTGWLWCWSRLELHSDVVVPTAFHVELHSSQRSAVTLTHLRNPWPQTWF